ncbi:hypothetical protein A9332_000906 [Escherichia coli]|nr:hypothetical protein [Escherichia coli]
MNELILIEESIIDDELQKTVNARDLHEALGVGRRFADWIKDNLKDFQENQDFVIFSHKREKIGRGRPTQDYALTLDTAKHICMMSRCEKGKQLRQYFIEVEKKYNSIALPDFSNPAEAARAWANEYEQKQLALQRVEQLEIVVEETTKYYSLMRVLIANPESHLSKYTAWRPLKKYCQDHGLGIKKAWDDRYGSVNTYPREAWEEVYPYINLPDECAKLLGEGDKNES